MEIVKGLDLTLTIPTYVPVVRPKSIRLFLIMVVLRQLYCEQIDYTTAYLNPLIDNRSIFIRPPTGNEILDIVCMIN